MARLIACWYHAGTIYGRVLGAQWRRGESRTRVKAAPQQPTWTLCHTLGTKQRRGKDMIKKEKSHLYECFPHSCKRVLAGLQYVWVHAQKPLVPLKPRTRLGCWCLQWLVVKSCWALATAWIWHPCLKFTEPVLHKFQLQCACRESPGLALGSHGKSNKEKRILRALPRKITVKANSISNGAWRRES